nr:PREDICTED: NEDD4-binding protein 2 isoform X2 [Latimeria chalumnae]|eukprot:XP_006001549.1 PREDICTED: NEDD4-binding protein 2 isoform X2 [Latimeria chalumnae]
MPRKKKNAAMSPCRKPGTEYNSNTNPSSGGGAFTASHNAAPLLPAAATATTTTSRPSPQSTSSNLQRDELLNSMLEMFSHLDHGVVYMVLSECDFKVEVAMDSLLELSTAAEGVSSYTKKQSSGFDSLAATLISDSQDSSQGENESKSVEEDPIFGPVKELGILESSNVQLTEEFDSLIQNEYEKCCVTNPFELQYHHSSQMDPHFPNHCTNNELPELIKSSLCSNYRPTLQKFGTSDRELDETSLFNVNSGHDFSVQPSLCEEVLKTVSEASTDSDITAIEMENKSLSAALLGNAGSETEFTGQSGLNCESKNSLQMSCTVPGNVRALENSFTKTDHYSFRTLQEHERNISPLSATSSSDGPVEQQAPGQEIISIPDLFDVVEQGDNTQMKKETIMQSENVHNSNASKPVIAPTPPQTSWNLLAPEFMPLAQIHTFVTPVAESPTKWRVSSERGTSVAPPQPSVAWSSYFKLWDAQFKNPQMQPRQQMIQLPVSQSVNKKIQLIGKVLILLRGLPGSGKSTLARDFLQQNPDGIICSTDDYFCQGGKYKYNPDLLGEAHEWNRKRAKEAFEKRISPIIIDNTNIQAWEMKPCIEMALQHKYKVMFREPDTWWKFKPRELESTHNVPKEKIKIMLERYEQFVSVKIIMNSSAPERPTFSAQQITQDEGNGKDDSEVNTDIAEEETTVSCTSQAIITDVKDPEDTFVRRNDDGDDKKSSLNATAGTSCKADSEMEQESLRDAKSETTVQAISEIPLYPEKLKRVDSPGENPLLSLKINENGEKIQEGKMEDNINTESSMEELVKIDVIPSGDISLSEKAEAENENKERQGENDHCEKGKLEVNVGNEDEVDVRWSVRPELLNFVGDWPIEQSLGQRNQRTRKKQKSLSIQKDKETRYCTSEDSNISDVNKGFSKHLNELNDGQSENKSRTVIDDQPLLFSSDTSMEKHTESNSSATDNVCVEGVQGGYEAVDNDKPKLFDFVGDWPIANSIEQRQQRQRQNPKSLMESSQEVHKLANAESEQGKDTLKYQMVDLLHTALGRIPVEENQELPAVKHSDDYVSESTGEKKSGKSKRMSRQCKLALTFTNNSPVSSELGDQVSKSPEPEEQMSDTSTPSGLSSFSQTAPEDFALLWRIEKQKIDISDHKILVGKAGSFDPRVLDVVADSQPWEKVPYRAVHDKSTYVEESEFIDNNEGKNLEILCKHFKGVSFDVLKDLYEKCKDMEWTINLLLDSGEKLYRVDDIVCQNPVNQLDDQCNSKGVEYCELLADAKVSTSKDDHLQSKELTSQNAQVTGSDLARIEMTEPSSSNLQMKSIDNQMTSVDETDTLRNQAMWLEKNIQTSDTAMEHLGASIMQVPTLAMGQMEQFLQTVTNTNEGLDDVNFETMIVSKADLEGMLDSASYRPKIELDKEANDQPIKAQEIKSENDKLIAFSKVQKPQFDGEDFSKEKEKRLEEAEDTKETSVSSAETGCTEKVKEVKQMNMQESQTKNSSGLKRTSESLSIHSLELCLAPELAFQLSDLFGPVGVDPDSLTVEDCVVKIDLNLAKLIHQKWKDSLLERQRQGALSYQLLQDDPKLYEQLQLEGLEEAFESQRNEIKLLKKSGSTAAENIKSVHVSEGLPFKDCWNTQSSKVSLKEIISEELALQSQYDLIKSSPLLPRKDCATKLKEKQLFEMFPTIDRQFLMDIFKDNNHSLELTELFLKSVLDSGPAKTVVAQDVIYRNETLPSNNGEKNRDKVKRSKGQDDVGSEAAFQDIEYPNYDDFRAEAFLHYHKQQECLKKADEAYRRGMKQVATFYAQQGQLHGQKMKEANHLAAIEIFERVNASLLSQNVLDLHGLHVEEAIHHLDRVLQQKVAETQQTGGKPYLSVITGRGNRSQGGVARIKPAVIDYLTNHSFRFTEPKPGLLKIMLR